MRMSSWSTVVFVAEDKVITRVKQRKSQELFSVSTIGLDYQGASWISVMT